MKTKDRIADEARGDTSDTAAGYRRRGRGGTGPGSFGGGIMT